ncbi:MAG TPA: hypothetical protein PKL08_18170, partial [Thermoanaerobaculaceae bacterium]|nr:hypothetical protein [Thermoanaerobaculaceae bacterium]
MLGKRHLEAKVAFWALVVTAASFLLVAVVGAVGVNLESIGRDNFVAGLIVAVVASWILTVWAFIAACRTESFSVGDRRLW